MQGSVSAIFLKLDSAIRNCGITIVMGTLDELNEKFEESFDKKIEKFIVSESCKHFKVSVSDVLTSADLYGQPLVARNMCVVLMNTHLKEYSKLKIAKVLKKETRKSVYSALDGFMQMNRKIKHEREFLDAYEVLNSAIETYRTQLTLVNK